MLRALGLGKPPMVSDLGSFANFPATSASRCRVGAGEEDLIFEYLNLLVSRPALARDLGRGGRGSTWTRVQLGRRPGRYAAYLRDVADVGASAVAQHAGPDPVALPIAEPATVSTNLRVTAEYLASGCHTGEAREYLETH